MELKDICDTGSDILGAVTDAIEKNDYSQLSTSIEQKVEELTKEIKQEATNRWQATAETRRSTQGSGNLKNYATGTPGNRMTRSTFSKQMVSPYFRHKISRMSGIGKIIVGIVCTGFSGVFLFVFLTAFFLVGGSSGLLYGLLTFCAGLLVASILVLSSGIKRKNLVGRYFTYGKMIGDKEYFYIEELADLAGKSKDFIYRDILKMKKVGMLPQVKMDSQKTTLILTQTAYDQYMIAEEERKSREENARSNYERSPETREMDEVKKILREGNSYLHTIRECNEKIPDSVMSDKIFALEKIMNRIFDQVEKRPESARNLHKFMNYYLPTTTKLLTAYIDLEKQPEQLENIANTKKEIEDSMDIIRDAFEKLLDSLFQDMAWDISADISVMKTMIAQDGLSDKSHKPSDMN